jgi:hypothetical protein
MFRWLKRKAAPLSGAPSVRRQKTYSAQSGYVYQYFYEGHRVMSGERGIEYVFNVSADRSSSSDVSVLLCEEATLAWEKEYGRTLSATERYAIAKMALFQAFDERETPEALREAIRITPNEVRALLATLNID